MLDKITQAYDEVLKWRIPWWHHPGCTFTGRCRMRGGQIIIVIPSDNAINPAAPRGSMYCGYVCVDERLRMYRWLYWDLDGNVLDSMHRDFDLVENLENTTHD